MLREGALSLEGVSNDLGDQFQTLDLFLSPRSFRPNW